MFNQAYLRQYHTQHTVCGDGRISSIGPEDSGDGHGAIMGCCRYVFDSELTIPADAGPRGPVNKLPLMDIVTQPLDYVISTDSPYEVVIRRV